MKKKRFYALALALAMSVTPVQSQPFNMVESVQAATSKNVALNKTDVSIKVGMKTKLKLNNADSKKVTWKSSDKKIATVKKGVVTGKKAGRVTITAKYNGNDYSATIRVRYISKKLRTTLRTANQGADLIDFADDDENVIFSPVSLNMALSMALNGSKKKAGKEIEKYLGGSKEEVNKVAKKLMKISKKRNTLNIANGIWYKKGFSINKPFTDIIKTNYKADCYESKLDKSTVDEINNWVDKETDGLIKKAVDGFDKDASAVLINTLLFEGRWDSEFNHSNNKKKNFTEFSGKKKKVTMMCNEEYIYFENDKATGFEKYYEYGDGDYSFIAILPKKKGKFSVKDLDLASFLDSRTYKYDVDIEMPKFSYDWDGKGLIKKYLKSKGVKSIFDKSGYALNNMINSPESIYVDDIIQKCKIELDEEGTKAAAYTSVEIEVGCALETEVPPRKEVILDRPFAYLIVDKSTGQTLFMGKVTSIDK